MKWFKLDSDFYKDPKVIECMIEKGKDAYVLWTVILGMLAERYEGNPKTKFQLSFSELRLFSRLKQNNLRSLLDYCHNKFGIMLEYSDNNVIIEYPKFLEKQQKYFHSGRQFDKFVSIDIDKDKDKEEDKKKIVVSDKPKPTYLVDKDYIDSLKTNTAYQGIDIDRELAKMDAWLSTPRGRGKKKTRGFIVNWLNRIDKPMDIQESLVLKELKSYE
jgi:hypothetical protein